jgi:hypothetical protein
MHTSTAPKNLIFPSQSVGEKSISARQNTDAQFLIPFVIQAKKRPRSLWKGHAGPIGRAAMFIPPHLDYARPIGGASGGEHSAGPAL